MSMTSYDVTHSGTRMTAVQEHPFIEQIDHIGIQACEPQALFSFFSEELELPVAFPYTEYPGYFSGSVGLGNAFLEIMRFGDAGERTPAVNEARYYILGFLNKAGSLFSTIEELEQRQIAHGGIVPFFDPEATDSNPIRIWDNIYLGELLGQNGWMRLMFAMTRRANPTPSMVRSPLMSSMSLGLMRRAFAEGMPVLTEYYRRTEDHRAAIGPKLLQERDGGLLGVECVERVVVAVRDIAPWARFLAPVEPGEAGVYRLGDGPALELQSKARAGVRTMVLRVGSLEQVRAALDERGYGVAETQRGLAMTVPGSGGLTVHFTSR